MLSAFAALAENGVPGGVGLIRNGSGNNFALLGNFCKGDGDIVGYGAGGGLGDGRDVCVSSCSMPIS